MSRKRKLIIFFILAVAVAGAIISFRRSKEPFYNFVVAQKGNLIQQVSVVGRVEPAKSVDLAFEKGGRVVEIMVRVGDEVSAGQTLVALDKSDLMAQLDQYQAALESSQAGLKQYEAAWQTQQAKLAELKAGAKPEEIKISETKVANAEKSLADARINLEDVKNKADIDLNNLYGDIKEILNDAYTKANNAVNQQIDELFSSDASDDPKITFSTSDSQAKIDAELQRVAVGKVLGIFKTEIDELPVSSSSNQEKLDQALVNGKNHLMFIRNFLDCLNNAVNGAINLSATVISSYKGNINTAQTNLNTAISNINAQQQLITSQKITNQSGINAAQTQINNALNVLNLVQDELVLKKSGATSEQIRAQELQVKQAELNVSSQKAQVKQAAAAVESVQSQLSKMTLRTPIDGVITKQESKVGEIASPNVVLASVISQADFEIKANVPEVDIAKVKVGDLADVTLDAYSSDDIFKARVASINPAETIIEGVATYEIILSFIEKDQRIKSGMTADMDILTEKKENVLIIPSRAVANKNGGKFVEVLIENPDKKEIVSEVTVETGLRGSDGQIEIIKGIEPGDKVVIP